MKRSKIKPKFSTAVDIRCLTFGVEIAGQRLRQVRDLAPHPTLRSVCSHPIGGDLVEQAMAELDAVLVEACQPWAHQIELLQTIHGVGEKVAPVIIAETGGDMARFPTAAHLAGWAGLAPAMNGSAGKQSPAGKRHGNRWLNAMLVEAAGSVGRMHGKTTWPLSTPGY
jgi:hypothetical protein